ncbi:MAG: hypothetical protein ACEQSR_15170 [Candidatus Methylacidiphilales bacterium]
MKIASIALSVSVSAISRVCNGKREHIKGYAFKKI